MKRSPISRRLVAVAGVALAVVAGLATTSTPAGATTTRRGPVPALPRTSVPWATVGPGWYLATDSTDGRDGSAGTTSVLLVAPTGARYSITHWPASSPGLGELTAWSPDHTHALFTVFDSSPRRTSTTIGELDLRTGAHRSVKIGDAVDVLNLKYAWPHGSSLFALAATQAGNVVVDRFSLSGRRLGRFTTLGFNGSILSTPDGHDLVLGTTNGIQVVSASGRSLRSIAADVRSCAPLRWWNPTTVLTQCYRGSVGTLTLFPLKGGAPRSINLRLQTDPYVLTGDGSDIQAYDAWQLPTGLYTYSPAVKDGFCGYSFLGERGSDGQITPVGLPGNVGYNVSVLDQQGPALGVVARSTCDSQAQVTLARFAPATHSLKVLLAAQSGTVGILDAVPFPTASTPGI